MLKKWVKQTAMQVSTTQNSCWRSTHLLTWALQKDIHSVYTKWSMEWMNMHTCWNKGHSKIPLYTIINMQLVAAGSSRQVKIGLNQFVNCSSQVKINVTTVDNTFTQQCSRSVTSSLFFCRKAVAHMRASDNHPFFAKCSLNVTRRPSSADRTSRAANFRRDLEAT